MTAPPENRADSLRPLGLADLSAIRDLLGDAAGPATYVGNDLGDAAICRQLARRALGVFQGGTLAAMCWHGGRANLMVIERPGSAIEPAGLAAALGTQGDPWRIALGPLPLLAGLASGAWGTTRILRTQIFCAAERTAQVTAAARTMRLAERADLPWLVEAAIELNRTDLGLAPDEVAERWVREAARARLRAGATFVVGARGAPLAKLDLGSRGVAGAVIEGVFTAPRARGQGLAAGLVAAVCAEELRAGVRRVVLHVDRDNGPARACYARAGMREVCESGLLLRDA